jgi:uncharacterized coiled-coil protein SlyX
MAALPYGSLDYDQADLTGYANLDGIANNRLIYVEDEEAKQSGLEWTTGTNTTTLKMYSDFGIFSLILGVIETDSSSIPLKMHITTGGIAATRGITITSTGRVGFGVTDPTEDFELDGNIQLDTGGTSKIIFYDKPNDHTHAEIDATGEGVNGGVLVFKTKADGGSVGERVRITADGYVGINDTSPNKPLVVGGDADVFGNFLVSGGTVTLPTATAIGNVSSTEIGYLDGVTSAIQTQINTKAPTASPTFTGTVTCPATTSIGNVSSTEIGYLDGVTSAIQTQINTKAPTASPTFTGNASFATLSSSGNGVFFSTRIGDMGYGGTTYVGIAHNTLSQPNNYSLLMSNVGQTLLNSATGQDIVIRTNNAEYAKFDGPNQFLRINQYGFYSTPGVTVNVVEPLIFFIQFNGIAYWWCRNSNNDGGLIQANNFFATTFPSDDRLKYNETAFSNGIELIKQLRPTKYDQVNSVDDDESTGIPQYGFIADEVESIPGLDILVNEKPDQHYPENGETVKALHYNGIMTISVQALKEVISLVETQQTEISRLSAAVTSLETRADTLETTVASHETTITRLNDRVTTLENQRTENASLLTDIVSRLRTLEEA